MGLSAHQKNGGHDEWLTPPEILRALGTFDLDPCAPIVRPWDTAAKHYTVADDGLALPWAGRVWCNPPFGREAVKWRRRMRAHGNGVALIPARTETAMFYETVWGAADGVLFLKGRPHFHYVDGRRADFNSGAPIALAAYGSDNLDALRHSGLGFVVVGHNVKLRGCRAFAAVPLERWVGRLGDTNAKAHIDNRRDCQWDKKDSIRIRQHA